MTKCFSIQLCRQQEEETQHPVEEWRAAQTLPDLFCGIFDYPCIECSFCLII